MLVNVLIPVELNPMGLIRIFPVVEFLLTYTDTDVPIPTERLGCTLRSILSPFDNSWEVETETVDFILWTFPTTCEYVLSNEYFSSSFPLLRLIKNNSGELIEVFIPIVFLFLFTA